MYKACFFFFIVFLSSCVQPTEAWQVSEENIDSTMMNILLHNPDVSTRLDKYLMLKCKFDSLEVYRQLDENYNVVRLLINLAEVFRNSGNYDDAIAYQKEALLIIDSHNLSSQRISVYKGFAGVYYEVYAHTKDSNYLQLSEKYGLKALEMLDDGDGNSLLASIYNIMGGIQIHKEDYQQALFFLEKAQNMLEIYGGNAGLAILANQAYVYNVIGDHSKAIAYGNQCYQEAEKVNDLVFCGLSLQILVNAYENSGAVILAQESEKKLKALQSQNDVVLNTLLVKELAEEQTKNKHNRIVLGLQQDRYFYVGLSVILLVISLFLVAASLVLFYGFKQIRKLRIADKELSKAKELADQLKICNADLHLKATETASRALRSELAFKEISLNSKLLSLSQLNEFLLDLKHHIQHDKSQLTNKIAINQLQKLELKVGQQLKGNGLEEFDMIMTSGNSNFIHALSSSHPVLTTNEKRLCYLILMNFTTKEISNILLKSYRAVEMARHRLRSKLGLNRNQNIHNYLLTYSDLEEVNAFAPLLDHVKNTDDCLGTS